MHSLPRLMPFSFPFTLCHLLLSERSSLIGTLPHSAMMFPATVLLLSALSSVVHSSTNGCIVSNFYDASKECEGDLRCVKPLSDFKCRSRHDFYLQYYNGSVKGSERWEWLKPKFISCDGTKMNVQ
ncbi:hypothetical protein PMAYCL1PPCAC_18959 [Pristionchus mayeri]|uniref:Uncharacterized protein n=1 Tax=Pristionchus mayeri TaxID=1317129 RepID=A0AAN5I1Y7_9BILA|nr:hypothetical protein PMAYCL1PPCAC_18959 [Pristionchus mayeri]